MIGPLALSKPLSRDIIGGPLNKRYALIKAPLMSHEKKERKKKVGFEFYNTF